MKKKNNLIKRQYNPVTETFRYVYKTHAVNWSKNFTKITKKFPSKVYIEFVKDNIFIKQYFLIDARYANDCPKDWINCRTFKNKILFVAIRSFYRETFNKLVACANNYNEIKDKFNNDAV